MKGMDNVVISSNLGVTHLELSEGISKLLSLETLLFAKRRHGGVVQPAGRLVDVASSRLVRDAIILGLRGADRRSPLVI